MKIISTANAPRPGGHYSQGVVHGGFLFVAGQLPIEPLSGKKLTGSIEEQALRALENVKAIVEAAGGGLGSIVKTTVYVSDMELWGRVNTVYESFFGEHRPARAVVPVNELHYGFLIEIEAVAAIETEAP